MKFAIFTHVPHGIYDNSFFAYAPYVKEMNIWNQFVDEVLVVAPLDFQKQNSIDLIYNHPNIDFIKVRAFNFLSFKSICRSFLYIPFNLWIIFKTIRKSDHIHLRCPGNIGLLACLVQIMFPNKIKTAKYAGNWDPNSKQPLSYKVQKWILSNTFLTKNMQVLVYGEWKNQTKNIKPFFTASYKESEKLDFNPKKFDTILKFIFVGTLTSGKNPMYAIQILESLLQKNNNVTLEIYGEGAEKWKLDKYISEKKLTDKVFLKNNQPQEVIKKAYQESHFMILPSESEGWPKVVAEAMFWGCLPISSNVSCVANMLDHNKRGLLLEMNLEKDVNNILQILNNLNDYQEKVLNAQQWSRGFTLDFFESEIKKLVQ